MRRVLTTIALFSVFSILNVATVLVLLSTAGVQVGSADPAGPPCIPGNVNGDGALDLGDPIYLLQHLFQSGPAPIACAQATGGGCVLGTGVVSFAGVANQTRYQSLIGGEFGPFPGLASTILPRDGVFRNLTVQGLENNEATTVTIDLVVNGQETALSLMNPPAGQSVVDPDEVCVLAGDLVQFRFNYPPGLDEQESMQVSVSFD